MRHSTLTNADDLHYAKIRTFAGNPSLVVPEFSGQIFASIDTNKIYRATGVGLIELAPQTENQGGDSEPPYAKIRTFAGNPSLVVPDFWDQIFASTDTNKIYRATEAGLIELAPQNQGGGGETTLVTIGDGYPAGNPLSQGFIEGSLYFDRVNSILYICKPSSSGWQPTTYKFDISCTVSNFSGYSLDSETLDIYASEFPPQDVPFDFSELIQGGLYLSDPDLGNTIGKIIQSKGVGFFFVMALSSQSVFSISDINLTFQKQGYLYLDDFSVPLTANGYAIPSKTISLGNFPSNQLTADLTITIS